MKLIFLGTGDSFCSDGRGSTSILVESESTVRLLGCPPQIVHALRSNGRRPNDVNYALISHLHGDHVVGLVFLAECLLYRDKGSMAIFGPKGLESLIYNLHHRVFSKTNLSNVLNFLSELSELPFDCSTSRGVHSPPDTIYRLELELVGVGDDLGQCECRRRKRFQDAVVTNRGCS